MPEAIRQIIKTESDIDTRLTKIAKILESNESKNAYLSWSNTHKKLIEGNTALKAIDTLAAQIIGRGAEEGQEDLSDSLASQLELLLCGLISVEDPVFTGLLEKATDSTASFEIAAPLMEKLEPEQIKNLLLRRFGNQFYTILHHRGVTFKLSLPLINKLNLADRKAVLLPYASTGATPLFTGLLHGLISKDFLAETFGVDFDPPMDLHRNVNGLKLDLLEWIGTKSTTKERAQALSFVMALEKSWDNLEAILGELNLFSSYDRSAVIEEWKSEQIIDMLLTPDYKGKIALAEAYFCEKATPLLESLLKREGGQEIVKKLFSKISGQFGTSPLHTPETFKAALPFLEKLDAAVIFELLSVRRSDNNETPLHHKEIFALAKPLLMKLSSKQIKDLLGPIIADGLFLKTIEASLNDPTHPVSKLEPKHLRELLSNRSSSGRTTFQYGINLGFFYGGFSKEAIHKVFGVDFDPGKLQEYVDEYKKDGKEAGFYPDEIARASIIGWIDSKPTPAERIKALYFPLVIGYSDIVIDRVEKLSPKEREELFALDPEAAVELKLDMALKGLQLREAHMQEGASLKEKFPDPVDMSRIEFVGIGKKEFPGIDSEEFYSFIPDVIRAAQIDSPLKDKTYAGLIAMEKKIRESEKIEGLDKCTVAERKEYYRGYCKFLTNVINSYKIGQSGGDVETKIHALDLIAESQATCFPRWKQTTEQIYFFRPRGEGESADETPPNLKDRELARLRVERIYILTTKVGSFTGNVHEPNYILNLFREELGTQLDHIDDRYATAGLVLDTKALLRSKFDQSYHERILVKSLTEHLNSQLVREKASKDPLDLPPSQVEEWLRAFLANTWPESAYAQVPAIVRKMKDEGQPIRPYLMEQGIDWRPEESVAEAEKALNDELRMVQNIQRTLTRIGYEIDDIFAMAEGPERILEINGFVERHPEITQDETLDKAGLEQAVTEWATKQTEQLVKLRRIQAELTAASSESEKKEIFKKEGRLRPEQPLEEVLNLSAIKKAQIDKFFRDEVFTVEEDVENTRFTHKAAALLLESMGVLEKAPLS